MKKQESPTLHIFILSDSIGETAIKVARSALAQFPSANTVLHKYTFISNLENLLSILRKAHEVDGLVFMTIVDTDLAREAEKFCIETGLICYNLIQPFMLEVERRTGLEPSGISGVQHELTDKYFDRIEAMEFFMNYDDGKDPSGILEAEVVLLGVSRTGKTPLSMFLATLGYKVANLPLMPENKLPEELFEVDSTKIVGLTNDVTMLSKRRKYRMIEYGLPENSRYATKKRIQEELDYSENLYRELGCPVLDVSERSIEESATIIIEMLNLPVR